MKPDRVAAIKASVKRSKAIRVRRLLGRYQGPVAAFDLVRAPGHGVAFLRRSQPVPGGRVWWDPKRWERAEVERLVRLKVWTPIPEGGADARGLLRLFDGLLREGGEDLVR